MPYRKKKLFFQCCGTDQAVNDQFKQMLEKAAARKNETSRFFKKLKKIKTAELDRLCEEHPEEADELRRRRP